MRISFPYSKSNFRPDSGNIASGMKAFFRCLFIFALSLSITFSNFAQEEESDFLDKVLEEKPKKVDTKKLSQGQPQNPASKDKKKKVGTNTKKNVKTTAKHSDTSKRTKPTVPITSPETNHTANPSSPQMLNSKLNLEYWVYEELTMSPRNIPGLDEPKVANLVNPASPNSPEKPIEKKTFDKKIEKESKLNPFLAFLNEYKKIIFIFAAIIIFAIYRIRYAGSRNYDNSSKIFSKFRNK